MIRAGANVNALDKNMNTPLHLAAAGDTEGHAKVVGLLIGQGADINAANFNNGTYSTPWDVANPKNQRSKF